MMIVVTRVIPVMKILLLGARVRQMIQMILLHPWMMMREETAGLLLRTQSSTIWCGILVTILFRMFTNSIEATLD